MKRILLALALLVLPAIAQAQEVVPIDGYRLNIYPGTGAAAPLTFTEFLSANVTCNQTPPPPGTTINPNKAVWDDAANAGKVCIWTDPGTGPLLALPPVGTFEATLSAYNAAGRSVESNRAPFSRLTPPAVRTGFKIAR